MFGLPWIAPNRREFAQLMVKRAKAQWPDSIIQLDEEAFAVRVLDAAGTQQNQLNLGNVFLEFRAARPWKRAAIIERLMSVGTVEVPKHFFQVRDRLMPRIVDRLMIEFLRLQHPPAKPVPHRLFGNRLAFTLAVDFDDRMAIVHDDDLENWGRSFDECAELALENLDRASPTAFEEVRPGLFRWSRDDGYAAARILLLERIRKLAIRGRPVAVVPNRASLLVTGEDDLDGLRAMLELAEKEIEGARPLTAVPHVLDGNRWSELRPADEGLARRCAAIAAKDDANLYAEQSRLLTKYFEATGADVFVGNILWMPDGSGGQVSVCSWAQGVLTLLPKTERIAFGAEGRPTRLARWADVERVVGPMLQPEPDRYPARHRVSQFPTEEQFAQMGAWVVSKKG
jgi:hypothetical protein